MNKLPLLLLTAGVLMACGQKGPLLLPSGKPPLPGSADQVGQPAEDDEEKKAKPDGG
jgi:predicted small lipoprotein YifL